MSYKRNLVAFILIFCQLTIWGMPRFSTAGFYELPNTGREAFSMNLAWRYYKGDVKDASSVTFDDSKWEVVSIPHGLEYLPIEASGCANYQGIAWYRKHFTPESRLKGKKIFIHFEAIMGKSEIYLNGKLLTKHYGGYLPVIADATDCINWNGENVLAVKADNSDDPLYPMGKPQHLLGMTYFGGMYRDCWLIAHNAIFVTDPNYENEVAGGGMFVSYDKVSDESAIVNLKTHIRNASTRSQKVKVSYALKNKDGETVKTDSKIVRVTKGKATYTKSSWKINQPSLWSPEHPYLYNLDVTIQSMAGDTLDGFRKRIGIRSIEFKQTNGLWLNGKPYEGKIMGTNMHQEYGVLGSAVPNSLQWQEAKKIRNAGLRVARAHYVYDPAFMDACDELGILVLISTPGWQFWNQKETIFGERVLDDIRNMIRINRNHASLFFWEPILNETHYPDTFAKNAKEVCDKEYPYPYSIAACDHGAKGDEYFSLLLRPIMHKLKPNKTYFIREWGDNVDDWSAQNSDSRVAREWGETPMLLQAEHYADPWYAEKYNTLCYNSIYQTPRQITGACFWHSFDHMQGYTAHPFYGGMMDAMRQPKTSYYMFMAQREPEKSDLLAETGPMIYIAHELTPFSPKDITVYSNCDEVRLTVFKGGKQYTYKKDPNRKGMPSPIIKFEDAFDFMEWKSMARKRLQNDAYLLAEGLIDGKVVATHKRYPAGQIDHLVLRLDNQGVDLKADGSDVVQIIAEMVDKRGTVKRLDHSLVQFSVEGEGRLLASEAPGVNPQKMVWGSAVAFVQASNKPGKIKVTASAVVGGKMRPLDATLEFTSVANPQKEIYSEKEYQQMGKQVKKHTTVAEKSDLVRENEELRKRLNQLEVKEVEKQQTHFGVGMND